MSRLRGALLFLGLPTIALAQARPDSAARDAALRLQRVVIITATTPLVTSGGGSAIETRLDSLSLVSAPTVDRVLRELPFVQVRTNARGERYFSIRGSGADAREAAVLVDGVPVSLNFDHRADLSLLPAEGAQTVRLVRGLPSLLYGPNVLGGVVELGVANAPATDFTHPTLQFSGDIDRTDAYASSGSFAAPFHIGSGALTVRGGGGVRHVDGVPLPGGVQEPAPYSGDDLRLNSDARQTDGFATARYDAASGAFVGISTLGYTGMRGTPAELNSSAPQLIRYPALRRRLSIASFGTGDRASLLGGRMFAQASVATDLGKTDLIGYTSRTYATVKNRESDKDQDVSARVLAGQSIANGGQLQIAGTYADVRRLEVLTPGATSSYRQRLWSEASELSWELGGAKLGLSSLRPSVGVAYDAAATPETGGKPALPVLWEWGQRAGIAGAANGGDLLFHAGFNHRVRFPSLREMYSGTLTSIEPNPNLRPERLNAIEGGSTARLAGAQVQVVLFHNDITDAIVRSTTPQKKVKRINRDETKADGVELLVSRDLGPALLSGDLTAQSVTSHDPTIGTEFHTEYQPKFSGRARVETAIPLGLRTAASMRGVGAQYCLSTTGAYTRLGATMRTDAELSRQWSVRSSRSGIFSTFETAVSAENLGNSAIYDQCGLPQPGRLVRFQFRLR